MNTKSRVYLNNMQGVALQIESLLNTVLSCIGDANRKELVVNLVESAHEIACDLGAHLDIVSAPEVTQSTAHRSDSTMLDAPYFPLGPMDVDDLEIEVPRLSHLIVTIFEAVSEVGNKIADEALNQEIRNTLLLFGIAKDMADRINHDLAGALALGRNVRRCQNTGI